MRFECSCVYVYVSMSGDGAARLSLCPGSLGTLSACVVYILFFTCRVVGFFLG